MLYLFHRSVEEKAHAQNFLQWFVDEQIEEVKKMDQLLNVIQRAGKKDLLMVEAHLAYEQDLLSASKVPEVRGLFFYGTYCKNTVSNSSSLVKPTHFFRTPPLSSSR